MASVTTNIVVNVDAVSRDELALLALSSAIQPNSNVSSVNSSFRIAAGYLWRDGEGDREEPRQAVAEAG